MERDSLWIWESGDPVERSDLLPNAGINDFDRTRAPHHNTQVQDLLISCGFNSYQSIMPLLYMTNNYEQQKINKKL